MHFSNNFQTFTSKRHAKVKLVVNFFKGMIHVCIDFTTPSIFFRRKDYEYETIFAYMLRLYRKVSENLRKVTIRFHENHIYNSLSQVLMK